MPVCKFYQQGKCKFGADCRFEHPGFSNNSAPSNRQSQPPNQRNQQNRYDAFTNPPANHGAGRGRGQGRMEVNQPHSLDSRITSSNDRGTFGPGNKRGGFQGGKGRGRGGHQPIRKIEMRLPAVLSGPRGQARTISIESSVINLDLGRELPMWLMSCYSPTPEWPRQLFEGESTEQSPEEIRVLFEIAKAQNNPQQYIQLEQRLAAEAEARRQNVLNNLDEAMQYLDEAKHERPNRVDICRESEPKGQDKNIFAVSTQNRRQQQQQHNQHNQQQGAFGRNNQSSQQFAATNQSNGFGQPAQTFGQPALGSQPPAQFGQTSNSTAFGQPNQGFSGAGNQSGFGSFTNQGTNNSGFLGAQNTMSMQQNSPLGLNQAQNNAFASNGNVNPLSNNTGFPQAQQAQQEPTQGVFGLPATQPQLNGGIFGNLPQPQQEANGAFGSAPQANGLGFGTISSQQQQQQAQPLLQQNSTSQANGFGAPPQQPRVVNAPQITRAPDGRITSWNGRPVRYDENGVPLYQRLDGQIERIWFPDGAPVNGGAAPSETALDNAMKQNYMNTKSTGSFLGGVMPTEPPTGDMINWNI